jgi:small subunit ribosomal protein S6
MEKYEIMYILQATLDENARKAEIEKLHGILKANKIAVTDVKEWGVKDFAYVIKKQTKGYYVVLSMIPAKGLTEKNRRFS